MSPLSLMPCMNSQRNTTNNDCGQLAIISLGANLPSAVGTPEQTIRAALQELQQFGSVQTSTLHRTTPVDCPPDSPDFINAVALIAVSADLQPQRLLECLQEMEQHYGRQRTGTPVVNAPRSLDLDLISLGDWVVNEPHLILPHPRAAQRRFVLEPLHELLPNYVLPGLDVSVHELLMQLPD